MIAPAPKPHSLIGDGRALGIWIRAADLFAVSIVFLVGASATGFADLSPPTRPRGEPPMRIDHVVSSEPSCQPNCPEWISAQGAIEPGTAEAFAKAVGDLGGRRLPVLIHSHGGSVVDGLKMGMLIRAKGLAVAVARTLIANCPGKAPKCVSSRGQAITGGAACASACVLVFAGGVERLVGLVPLVGVHQITAVEKETEGAEHLTVTHKFYEPKKVDAAVTDYLTAMGVGDPVMTLLRKTSAASVRWLSDEELRDSHLATLRLDNTAPILSTGANGLNGHAFDGDPPRSDLLTASGEAALKPASDGRDLRLSATFSYRRGGGGVEATFALRDAGAADIGAKPGIDLKLAAAPDAAGNASAPSSDRQTLRVILPLANFCSLAHGGKFTATLSGRLPPDTGQGGGAMRAWPIEFDLAAMDGAKTLFREACS
jgi:hypothetical protein